MNLIECDSRMRQQQKRGAYSVIGFHICSENDSKTKSSRYSEFSSIQGCRTLRYIFHARPQIYGVNRAIAYNERGL